MQYSYQYSSSMTLILMTVVAHYLPVMQAAWIIVIGCSAHVGKV